MATSRFLAALLLSATVGCGAGPGKFPLKNPMWRDPDRRPVVDEPEEYFSPFAWDGANQMIFRPISRFFAVDPKGEATNVNALDEVPDSSWFTNRIGKGSMTPAQLARGSCITKPIDPNIPWVVTGAKPNGANPGFLIKAGEHRYLVKFDGVVQGARATAADVIGSRLYHAAGYFTPCNRIVKFKRSILSIDPEATGENDEGDKEPLQQKHLDTIFEKAMRLKDGRYRANASLFIDGKPIGPWKYQRRRNDDPNDVIYHEDRRDLRGARMLAAWTNHFDSREQNTLAAWVKVKGDRGYVRHYYIDFGDCFGSIWEPPMMGRRIGHAYYLDIPFLLEDFVTLGIPQRPWDRARFGKTGTVLGYYDVASFKPAKWRPGYPNPAFGAMSERDGAWMARIIAEFTDKHVEHAVATGDLDAAVSRELNRVLKGRRDAILKRYLAKYSALSHPYVKADASGPQLCLRDMAVFAKLTRPPQRYVAVTSYVGDDLNPTKLTHARWSRGHHVCTPLPSENGASSTNPSYMIVDLTAAVRGKPSVASTPARVHLYQTGAHTYRIVGLERPDTARPPKL